MGLTFTTNLSDFAKVNAEYIDNYLWYHGVPNRQDREDISQTFFGRCCEKDLLNKEFSGSATGYLITVLQRTAAEYVGTSGDYLYHQMHVHANVDTMTVPYGLSDSTSAVENHCMIDHALCWVDRQHLSDSDRARIDDYVSSAVADTDVGDSRTGRVFGKAMARYRDERRAEGDVLYDDAELRFRPQRTNAASHKILHTDQVKRGWLAIQQREYISYYHSLDLHKSGCIGTEELQSV